MVAGEVRSLAQRSAQAAREIKALIGDSVDKVEAGSSLVGEAGATMAAAAESLKQQAAGLLGLVAAFRTGGALQAQPA